jgi:hypothetical protein
MIGAHLLLAVGCFAVVLAVLAPTYIYRQLAVLPLDPQRGVTLVGHDATATVPDTTQPHFVRTVRGTDVTVTNFVSAAPDGGDANTAVWLFATKVTATGAGLVNARVERVSLDRHTSLPTNCCGDRLISDEGTTDGAPLTHTGYLLWPFNTQPRDYQVWNLNLRRQVTSRYQGTETREGLTTYKFTTAVPRTKTGTMSLPGAVFGDPATTIVVDSMYTDTRTSWIEPNTGAVVAVHDDLTQEYAYQGRTLTLLDAKLDSLPNPASAGSLREPAVALPWLRERLSWVLAPVGVAMIALSVALRRRRTRRG